MTSPAEDKPHPLGWAVPADAVDAKGRDFLHEATSKERAGLADLLGIVSVEALEIDGRVKRVSKTALRVQGTLKAEITQKSVVSLNPVSETVSCDIDQLFDDLPEAIEDEDHEIDVDEGDPPEPLDGGVIPLGRLAAELLALEMDPYPKAPGETWQDHIEDAPDETEKSPFAVLKQLKT